MIIRYRVDERLPLPARTAINVVQAAAKTNRRSAEQLIHDGAVICRGRLITQTHHRLQVGDEVEIEYAPQPTKQISKKSKGSRQRFEVVHDDADIIVVNKPAGLLTVPSPHREKNTLLSQIDKWLQSSRRDRVPDAYSLVCVHRLDRGVSGLLVFAKSEEIATRLRDQFSNRKPARTYAAIVTGTLQEEKGTFTSYLTTDPQSLTRYSVENPEEGEIAITHYCVKERWNEATLVEVRLETGRRNQIRVQFAEFGHPIIGDPRYKPEAAEHHLWPHKRLALHAERLGFQHPLSQQTMNFIAPWPQEFRDLRRKLHKQPKG